MVLSASVSTPHNPPSRFAQMPSYASVAFVVQSVRRKKADETIREKRDQESSIHILQFASTDTYAYEGIRAKRAGAGRGGGRAYVDPSEASQGVWGLAPRKKGRPSRTLDFALYSSLREPYPQSSRKRRIIS